MTYDLGITYRHSDMSQSHHSQSGVRIYTIYTRANEHDQIEPEHLDLVTIQQTFLQAKDVKVFFPSDCKRQVQDGNNKLYI